MTEWIENSRDEEGNELFTINDHDFDIRFYPSMNGTYTCDIIGPLPIHGAGTARIITTATADSKEEAVNKAKSNLSMIISQDPVIWD